jgi:hypothetical protein
MKYTAKPVTQYARNKTAASQSPAQSVGSGGSHEGAKKKAPPAAAAAPTAASAAPTSANSSQQNNSSTINDKVNKGGLSWNRSLTTSNSSGDANSLTNVSAPANDLGKAKGGRQASTAAEKSSYSDWVTKQISSGKQSAQHMADQGYISKDRVGEYAKHAPKPAASTSSKNFDSSRKETLTPDMTEAVAPKTQTQTRAHEKRSSNRQWITSNMGNRIAASSQIRRAKRDGLFANGELTDKGRSSLSPEQQKGLSGAYDTKRGRNADQLAHANRTGKWSHGGNTHAGEKFVTEAGKASTQRKAQEGQETIDAARGKGVPVSVMNDSGVRNPTVKNKPGGVTEGTQVANNAATRVKSKFGNFSSSQAESDRIMAGVNNGTSKGANKAATDVSTPSGPEVSTKPQTRKEKQSFNKDRRKEASADRKANRNANKAERVAKRGVNKAERVAKRGVKAAGGADAVQSGKTFDDAGQAPKTSLINKPSKEVTISAGPKPEVKFTTQTRGNRAPIRQAEVNKKPITPDPNTSIDMDGVRANTARKGVNALKASMEPTKSAANYKMNRLHSSKSPTKMWGPSKVKAGKNGFNR